MIDIKDALIINHLYTKDTYTTSTELSQIVNVSTKTIKRNIASLNSILKKYDVEIISSRGLGYKLCGAKSNIKTIIDISKDKTSGFNKDDCTESRIRSFIKLLINYEYISIESISEKLNLSIPSINKLVIRVKEYIMEYNLEIKSKPYYGSYLVGEEKDIRQLIIDLLIYTNKNNNVICEIENISNLEIELIEKIILKVLNNKKIIISDKDFNILLFKIVISISRIKSNRLLNDYDENLKLSEIIDEIINDVSVELDIELDIKEISYINEYISKVLIDINVSVKENIEFELQNIITNTLKEIQVISGVKYEGDLELIKSIYEHVSRLINRIDNDIKIENPIMDQIKSRFPVEFDLAIYLGNRLKEKTGIILDENEIGYIAIHFAASNERMKKVLNKKIAIICHYGIGTGQFLKEKIIQDLPDVDICGVYPVRYLDFVIKQDVDLIISTIDLDTKDKEYIYVDNIFDEGVISTIKKSLCTKSKKDSYLSSLFKKESFISLNAKDKYEAIDIMTKNLLDKDLISKGCISKIIQREEVSSTEMTNFVAIPHTIVEENINSLISVGILDNKIMWGKQEVQLIFMIFLNKNESKNASVFREIYNFIKDEGSVLGIIKSKNYDKFINMIK